MRYGDWRALNQLDPKNFVTTLVALFDYRDTRQRFSTQSIIISLYSVHSTIAVLKMVSQYDNILITNVNRHGEQFISLFVMFIIQDLILYTNVHILQDFVTKPELNTG